MYHWDLVNRDSKYAASTFETQIEKNFSPQVDRFGQYTIAGSAPAQFRPKVQG